MTKANKVRYLIRRTAVLPIIFYRKFISPVKPRCCRYYPSCSVYAYDAVMKHGIVLGGFLAFRRILKCNPFGGYGNDPVPEYGELIAEKCWIFVKKKLRIKKVKKEETN